MGIRISQFAGAMPRLPAHNLPDNAASYALNCDFNQGTAKPLKGTAVHAATPFGTAPPPATVKTIFMAGDKGIAFPVRCNVVGSPTPGDTLDRIFWTGQGAPKMALLTELLADIEESTMLIEPDPAKVYALGVAAPSHAISASAGSTTNPIARQYVFTWVTSYGEESSPSPVSNVVHADEGQTVTLNFDLADAPGTAAAYRIYRTDATGSYRYLSQHLLTDTTASDGKIDLQLGEPLQTLNWTPPPSNLKGLRAGPNGILCGFFGNTVAFSQPYAPYAWPVAYQFNVDYPVVAVAANSGGWVILTEGLPYFIAGSSPDSMSMSRINEFQPCVSARSVVDTGDYIIYAGTYGLIGISGMNVRNMTQNIFTREQWQAINPKNINAFLFDSRYLAFNGANTFLLNQDEGFITWIDFYDEAAVNDYFTGDLYSYSPNRGSLLKWKAGDNMTMEWKSKRLVFEQAANVGAGWVDARDYPVSFKLYANDENTPIFDEEINDGNIFKLPGDYLANHYAFSVSGTNEVLNVALGIVVDDL